MGTSSDFVCKSLLFHIVCHMLRVQIVSHHCSTRHVFRTLVREIGVAFFVVDLLRSFL